MTARKKTARKKTTRKKATRKKTTRKKADRKPSRGKAVRKKAADLLGEELPKSLKALSRQVRRDLNAIDDVPRVGPTSLAALRSLNLLFSAGGLVNGF